MSARTRSAALLAGVAALTGCGVGAGTAPDAAQLRVSQDFGTKVIAEPPSPKVGGADTQMRFLQRNAADVKLRYGGKFVQEIEGVAGGDRGGRPYDWFFYVNGVLSDEGAASVELRKGDRVWWDHHDWGEAAGSPAVVGSFPQPFRNGIDGRRLPLRLECQDPQADVCDTVAEKLGAIGGVVSRGSLGGSIAQQTLRVVVGTWPALRGDVALTPIERGPDESGVYAKPSKDGKQLAILDPTGRTTRTLGPGSGLIAATRHEDGPPVWIVTGTDQAGIEAAAGALEEGALGGKFALAVADGRAVAVPDVARK